MGQLVYGAVGAVVGYVVGGPTGAQYGWAIGTAIGVAMTKGPTRHNIQPIADLKMTGSAYGRAILRGRGTGRVPADIWWMGNERDITTYSEEGGKGGGPSISSSTTIKRVDLLCGISEQEVGRPIIGISRVWDNGTLVYNIRSDASAATVIASNSTALWERFTVYKGDFSQLPDPDYEAALALQGLHAPAYRGRAYVYIKGFDLGQSGQMRNLTFEVVFDGETGAVPEPRTEDVVVTQNTTINTVAATDPVTGLIWHGGTQGVITVLSDVEETQVASFSGVGGSPGETHSIVFVPDLGEVWAMVRPFPIPSTLPLFHIFDAGTTNTNGELLTAPFLKETIYINDSQTGEFATYQNVAVYDESTGFIVTAGAQFAGSNLVMSIIDPAFRTFVDVWDAGVSIQRPYEITGGEDRFLVRGNLGSAGTDNAALTSPYFTSVLYTYQLDTNVGRSLWQRENQRFVLPIVGSVDYILLDYLGNADTHTLAPAADADTSPPISEAFNGGIVYLPEVDLVAIGARVNGSQGTTLYFVDPNSLQSVKTLSYETASSEMTAIYVPPPLEGRRYVLGFDDEVPFTSAHMKRFYFHSATLTPGTITVREAAEWVCGLQNMTASEFDASELDSIAEPVYWLPWIDVSMGRNLMEMLAAAYYFECTVSDKAYFIPRGGAAVADLAFEDLLDNDGKALTLTRRTDIEWPAQVYINYINIDDDYNDGTQISDRHSSTAAGTSQKTQLALGVPSGYAKAVADTMVLDGIASILQGMTGALAEHYRLECTDVINVTGRSGTVYRLRIVTVEDEFPALRYEVVLDEVAVLRYVGVTAGHYTPATTVSTPAEVVMKLMDIPLLRDQDDNAGHYAAIKADSGTFAGAVLLRSSDFVTYANVSTFNDEAVFGETTDALGDWTGGRMFDEHNSVTVDVGAGTLSGTTRSVILNDETVNAAMVGSELLQFRDATLVSAGVYRLTGLLRGGKGTEWATGTHVAGEDFVLLRSAGVRRIVGQQSDLGVQRYYKPVAFGQSVDAVASSGFTNTGISLKPYSVANVRASRNSNDDTLITWEHRSRYSTRRIGSLGVYIPQSELTEQYRLRIYNGVTLVRSETTTSPNYTWTAADRASDMGDLTTPATIEITQMSAVVGEGYEKEATV